MGKIIDFITKTVIYENDCDKLSQSGRRNLKDPKTPNKINKSTVISGSQDNTTALDEIIRMLRNNIEFLQLIKEKNNPEVISFIDVLEFHLSYFQTLKDEAQNNPTIKSRGE
jgi:hypothetical protein